MLFNSLNTVVSLVSGWIFIMTFTVLEGTGSSSDHLPLISPGPYQIGMQAIQCVHGFLDGITSALASLVIFECRFLSLRSEKRILSANIELRLLQEQDEQSDQDLEVRVIAPRSLSVSTPKTDGQILYRIEGTTFFDRTRRRTGARWVISENPEFQLGLPKTVLLGILVTRSSQQASFRLSAGLDVKVSGLLFTGGLRQKTDGDAILAFNPSQGFGKPGFNQDIDTEHLGAVNLEELVLLENPAFPSVEDVELAEKIARAERAERAEIEARLDAVTVQPQPDKPSPEPNPKPGPDAGTGHLLPSGNGFFALMWGEPTPQEPFPTVLSVEGEDRLREDIEQFKGIPARRWRRNLDHNLLYEYFPWLEQQRMLRAGQANEGVPAVQSPGPACVVLFRQLSRSGFRGFSQLSRELSDKEVETILPVMGLPEEHLDARKDESGSCSTDRDESRGADVYVVQTPLYGDEFWYLLLVTTKKPNRVAAVVYASPEIKTAEIFETVHNQASKDPHHLLLLLELFEDHFKRTLKLFGDVIKDINDIDSFLLNELPKSVPSSSATEMPKKKKETVTPEAFRNKALDYATKTNTLHQARMTLEKLRRRRDFEQKLVAQIEKTEALSGRRVSMRMRIYSSRANSHDTDLKDLPRRIESQSSVLNSLVAKQDSELQSQLTLSTVQDSRGMMTLSVITIVFLPGAFIATLFSTNMFEFRDKTQELEIYFGLVVPLTLVILVIWKMWLKSRPIVLLFDSELGNYSTDAKDGKKRD